MANKKDLMVLLLDVGEHMQPYLPLMHRMVFTVLNCKLLSKPNHEVAVVLYGTKGTRHKLYDPADPQSYRHVTVLRPLQNVGDYRDLAPFAFASDPRITEAADGGDAAAADDDGDDGDPAARAARDAALLSMVEAAGLACSDAAATCSRAARLFGPPGPRADWADGLVVALDVLASALGERFTDKREAGKLGQLRVMLVSNLLGESEPYDDDFRGSLVETCAEKRILLEVACLDPHPHQPSCAGAGLDEAMIGGGGNGGNGGDSRAPLPGAVAASRQRNLEQLHLLKSEMAPAPFRHLRQPAELLSLFRAKEVAYQASNAVLMLTPRPPDEEEAATLRPPLEISVKLYKKIRHTRVDEWKTVVEHNRDATPPAGGAGGDAGDGSGGGGPGFVREVEYEDPTSGQKFTRDDFIVKGYSYGKQAVPIAQYADSCSHVVDEQMRKFKEKDLSLLGFIDAAAVPHHRLIDEPHVVLGDAPGSAVAIASLALALSERNRAGVVRFLIRKEAPQLGLLTPHLSDSPDVPHALLLSPLPFAEDIRTHAFSTFRNQQEARDMPRLLAEARGEAPPPPEVAEARGRAAAEAMPLSGEGGGSRPSQLSGLGLDGVGGLLLGKSGASEPGLRYEKLQPNEEQQDAALALVRALDLGPSLLPGSSPSPSLEPHPEALAPETTANPALQRAYTLVTSRALDPTAQLPDPEEDPLVDLVLLPHGRYWRQPGAREAVRRAEQALRTRERADGEGPAAKRSRTDVESTHEAGGPANPPGAAGEPGTGAANGGGAVAEAGSGPGSVVFDPSAAGGTAAARVSRVRELTAVEDFRAMLAQGRDSASDAVQQLQELVRVLVARSIGDQLYDKAIKCIEALREGCAATGRAGAFNRFLIDLADRCKSQDRGAFLSLLTSRQVGLISHEDLHRRIAAAAATAPPAAAGEAHIRDDGGDDDDCGAVSAAEARRFLDLHSGAVEAEAEATLPAVVQDEEFEDMD